MENFQQDPIHVPGDFQKHKKVHREPSPRDVQYKNLARPRYRHVFDFQRLSGRGRRFYRPTEYKAPAKKELTDEERILASSGRSDLIATEAPQMIAGTTQSVFVQLAAVPAPPPETSAGSPGVV